MVWGKKKNPTLLPRNKINVSFSNVIPSVIQFASWLGNASEMLAWRVSGAWSANTQKRVGTA